MQYTYHCRRCVKVISAIDLIFPDYLKCRLPVHITKRSGVDNEVLHFIINGATTSTSFSSIKNLLSTKRVEFYQNCMLKYYTAADLEMKVSELNTLFVPLEKMEAFEVKKDVFTDMDDPLGINDVDIRTESYIREVLSFSRIY